jgi:hypothetical protein
MPIVIKSPDFAIVSSLSQPVFQELVAYIEWAEASRSTTISVALKRLFSDDEDWQENKKIEGMFFY